MKLTGNLKKQVEQAKSKDEARDLIENAGMLLDDGELSAVAGGAFSVAGNSTTRVPPSYVDYCSCDNPEVGESVFGNGLYTVCCKNCGKYITYERMP